MRIVKKSIILYILALVAFLEALYFLKEDNLTAGIMLHSGQYYPDTDIKK